MSSDLLKVGVLTLSDRAAQGVYEDISGKEIERLLTLYMKSAWQSVYRLIPDDKERIIETLIELVDIERCSLVVTTGGTGPTPRDVTPEATEWVCEKMLPGFGELMRQSSLKYVPTAILSRQTAGIRGTSLIVNLPGKPSAIEQCLQAIFPAIPYCLDLIGGPFIETDAMVMPAFRPKQK